MKYHIKKAVKFTALQSFIAQKSKEDAFILGCDVGIGSIGWEDVVLEKEIIQIVLTNSKITMPKIAEQLNVTTRTIERLIKRLREIDILEGKCGKRFGYLVIHK